MQPIVIATGNPGKVREIAGELEIAGVAAVGLADAPGAPLPEPVEDGGTFEANATIKARAYAAATGMRCLADDSGLEIDGLAGRPGVISSHYATNGEETGISREARDAANIERVLAELDGAVGDDRRARFVCVMVLADPDGTVVAQTRGTFEGMIGTPPEIPRGVNGFGYDPIFLPDATPGRTSAELAPDEKNALSHRGDALRQMVAAMAALRTGD